MRVEFKKSPVVKQIAVRCKKFVDGSKDCVQIYRLARWTMRENADLNVKVEIAKILSSLLERLSKMCYKRATQKKQQITANERCGGKHSSWSPRKTTIQFTALILPPPYSRGFYPRYLTISPQDPSSSRVDQSTMTLSIIVLRKSR